MSDYLFIVRSGELCASEIERCEAVAAKHECTFIYASLPDGVRSWFVGPNLGEPFNRALSARVLADLEDEGE